MTFIKIHAVMKAEGNTDHIRAGCGILHVIDESQNRYIDFSDEVVQIAGI